MSFLEKIFGTRKPRTLLDDVQETGGKLIVRGYRNLAAASGLAPTTKTTDEKIVQIYSRVGTAFNEAAKQRNERIPALHLNSIVFKFLQVYETLGENFMEDHLHYEIKKYLNEGLRDDYKRDLPLFDPSSNDPDVIKIKQLEEITRSHLNQKKSNKEF